MNNLITSIQFFNLTQNEFVSRFDKKGNLVFTPNKGLVAVGVHKTVWETIGQLKAEETYEHTITKSELYRGKKIIYQAPFNKCDRVEDYKLACEHFEKVFA